MRTWTSRGPVIMALALLGPALVGWLLGLARDVVDNANAALVLVLVVVGVAATGRRLAGIVAALSATAWFDFFLTEPYLTFTINDRNDVETAVLLILVGLAVTELSLWGRRQQGRASRREGYLSGVVSAARIVAAGGTPTGELVERIADQVTTVLDVDGCRYDDGARRCGTGSGRTARWPTATGPSTWTGPGCPPTTSSNSRSSTAGSGTAGS